MPSWPVHIALGNKLNQRLKLGDDFILGNVMPDCLNGYVIECDNVLSHRVTHYCLNGDGSKSKIRLDKFYNLYKDKFDNPIILGYYVHLFTDDYFNEYFRKHHVVVRNGSNVCVLNDGSFGEKIPRILKQKDFESFGKRLIKSKMLGDEIGVTFKTDDYLKDLPFKVDEVILKRVIRKINEAITACITEDCNYLVFNESELNDLFEGCYEEILKRIS